MKIVGIDPGLSGGIVAIDEDGKIIFKIVMPTMKLTGSKKTKTVIDLQLLHSTLCELKPDRVYLEKVGSRPGQGTVSMFGFGYTFGAIEMALVSCHYPYVLVTPQAWCKEMHQGISKDIDAKDRSLLIFKRMYPEVDMRATPRCTTCHDGMIDALMIAEYGRRCMLK